MLKRNRIKFSPAASRDIYNPVLSCRNLSPVQQVLVPPRLPPLVTLSRRTLPGWLAEWLELVPAAILSALLLIMTRCEFGNFNCLQ